MSWIIRDPPSPPPVNSSELENHAYYSKPSSPLPPGMHPPPQPSFSPPTLRLDLMEEQWSMNPLQIKSTFSTVGTGIQSLSSPACGMGWSFNLDLSPSYLKDGADVVQVHASLQSSPVGFQPGTLSSRASFRRGDRVLAVLENDQWFDFWLQAQGQNTISLGSCDISLPLGELFIDLVITVLLQSDSEADPRKFSLPMSKAIRATLDGNFPIDVKFMLFTHKYGKTSVCNRRPVYASTSILRGRRAFFESYINNSHLGDDSPPGIYQYPYDGDSDLESDLDEDPPCHVPGMSDSITREPRPESRSPALAPINITDLDTVQSAPPEFSSGEKSSAASILEADADLPPFSVTPRKKSSTKSLRSLASTDSLSYGKSNSICVSEYEKAEPPICDESMDRYAEVTNHGTEEYRVEPQQKAPTTVPHPVLVNDVAFRTFRALIVYMYTKEVAFIPLKSSGGRSYNAGDACSPKSMYRLAVKASHEGLKKHAFDDLRSQLRPENIVTEIFSKFTTDYSEIFEMELKVLLDHFTNPTVRVEWERMIDMVATGQLPHGANILKKVNRVLRT
ncbi:uncharacterized protein EV420DRAFT_1583223 [Desarmillaria tabescens]|uniref:BTB domain-containing protein n=1 Tax=Armillaria tabescens TaxID=1929756 RepID=A0AA39MN10_ARMTA|nr:uncharacterized protein EV420DRAFT_1583223 [Desarmillaria tabescens]KAK0439714.1 hypothetical protein EV420DRAFT_1583223 [Desarmillaria tabescens]